MADSQQVYFEDVKEGMELPPKSKGPLTITSMVKIAGATGDYTQIHHDREYAKIVAGLPDAILHGQARVAFMAHLVTDWIGLWGGLKKLAAQYTGMDMVGDTVVSHGKVSRKYTEGGENYVELELRNENLRAGTTTTGSALVTLPSRTRKKVQR